MGKNIQSEIYKRLKEPSHKWMECNINPAKVSMIINMQEQLIEAKAWKCDIDIVMIIDLCRLCCEVPYHITSGCKMLDSMEYMTRHNNLHGAKGLN